MSKHQLQLLCQEVKLILQLERRRRFRQGHRFGGDIGVMLPQSQRRRPVIWTSRRRRNSDQSPTAFYRRTATAASAAVDEAAAAATTVTALPAACLYHIATCSFACCDPLRTTASSASAAWTLQTRSTSSIGSGSNLDSSHRAG